MIRSRLQRLERKAKALTLDQENLPGSITLRVVGCQYPKPQRITLSDTGAIPIYHLCKPGGGECETCEHYHPERLRA